MKYFIYRNKESKQIYRIDSRLSFINKTDEKIETAISNFNKERGTSSVEVLDLDGTLEDVMSFFLGDKTYKSMKTISNLVDRLDELKDSIDYISYDINDMTRSIENCMMDIKKFEND